MTASLASTNGEAFVTRHIGPRPEDISHMLGTLGLDSLEDLLDAVVPPQIRIDRTSPATGQTDTGLANSGALIDLPAAQSEIDALATIGRMAEANTAARSLIGMGYYGTITPAVIRSGVLENPAWYTAYTPYQPEISQGRLTALLNFQTMVCDLTAMEIANSSLLDEGTAAAEAITMARRLVPTSVGDRAKCFIDRDCHPQTIAVIATRAQPLGIELVIGDPWTELDPTAVFAAVVQYPGSSGAVGDLAPIAESLHSADALLIAATDLLALCLLKPPGECGTDLVVGSTQRFGVPMGFGGPHAAFLAARDSHRRQMPGRLVGVSVDTAGRPALRLALQTREQHIRRDRATSNICTAQALLAVMASMYAVWHGPAGLKRIAHQVNDRCGRLAAALASLAETTVVNDSFFDTLTVNVPGRADTIVASAALAGINLRQIDDSNVGISVDETTDEQTLHTVLTAFAAAVEPDTDSAAGSAANAASAADTASAAARSGAERLPAQGPFGISPTLLRTTDFLTHPVFSSYQSETEMMRYLRRLADKDLALDRTMIPLGSCTMKLNAASEMTPITWPQFADVHPFAPPSQTPGYQQLLVDLTSWLTTCTGYDTASLQPNAGSQGELAGLLAIRSYHISRAEPQRDICLIPASAHGTNAASAVMAGMAVKVVACSDNGDVDLADLQAQIAQHGDRLAAVMVTYPSTHGVFEQGIMTICDLVHAAGGQVYVDGANLNALVGVAAPGSFGADVSHLNLHKTFCIPHGGGGPGVGPVVAKQHLAPFLPADVQHWYRASEIGSAAASEIGSAAGSTASTQASVPGLSTISAAPFGSAGILPITWMYITMMGASGLRQATQTAILTANYLAKRLSQDYEILYTGASGMVAHECVVDLRPLSDWASVEDVAKRLIDYGFHAPTMSFPVAGTLMIEPTESESLAEIDRFCDAMISIRSEIDKIARGEWPVDDNPLANAPHTSQDLLAEQWAHPYSRTEAAFPGGASGVDPASKYWPPVSRIDGAYGDRNLVCSCPDPTAFELS